MIYTHTIWYSNAPGHTPHAVDVANTDNAACIAAARIVWQALKAAGYHMVNNAP